MIGIGRFLVRVSLLASSTSVIAGIARAQGAAPTITGDGWIAIVIIAGLVGIILLMISGAIRLSGGESSDDGGAGFGVIEDVDEDEDKPKKR